MQASDPHPDLTLFLAVWAAVGPFVGLLAGHILTRSWELKRWRLDCRKTEFQELLSSFVDESMDLLAYFAARDARVPHAKALLEKLVDDHHATIKVIGSRIYIADDLDDRKIRARYIAIMGDARETEFGEDAKERLGTLMDEIVAMADKDK